MTDPKDPQGELRERIILILGNALYAGKSIEQISKITKKQLAPFEAAADQILVLFQAHQQELLTELLGELPKKYPEPTQAPDGSIIDEYKLAFNIAIDEVVSVIQSKIGELNG